VPVAVKVSPQRVITPYRRADLRLFKNRIAHGCRQIEILLIPHELDVETVDFGAAPQGCAAQELALRVGRENWYVRPFVEQAVYRGR
jgi:hypothetical protein